MEYINIHYYYLGIIKLIDMMGKIIKLRMVTNSMEQNTS